MGKCELVAKGIANKKGKPSIEFYKNGKPQYYCYGYMDKRTEEGLSECQKCPKWVHGEQLERDFEEAKRLGLLGKETVIRNNVCPG